MDACYWSITTRSWELQQIVALTNVYSLGHRFNEVSSFNISTQHLGGSPWGRRNSGQIHIVPSSLHPKIIYWTAVLNKNSNHGKEKEWAQQTLQRTGYWKSMKIKERSKRGCMMGRAINRKFWSRKVEAAREQKEEPQVGRGKQPILLIRIQEIQQGQLPTKAVAKISLWHQSFARKQKEMHNRKIKKENRGTIWSIEEWKWRHGCWEQ